jgi:hypothetical protein
MAIARQIRTMNSVPLASVEETQADPGHVDGASAARIAGSFDDVSSSMIDPTVSNNDPVPTRGELASSCPVLPPSRLRAASNGLRVTPSVLRGVSVSPGAPPDVVGSSAGSGGFRGGDVGAGSGVGVGAGEEVGSGDGDGSGVGSGDGSGEGSDEGSGVGDGVGGGSWAIAPGAATLRLKAIVKKATVPAWRTRLLRRLLDPLAT